jgi:hypothetical protein
MGKKQVVLPPGTLLHMLVLVGARPLLPTFMSIGCQQPASSVATDVATAVVIALALELRMSGLARAELLVLVLVLVGTNMWLVVGPLVVLMRLLELARARLLKHGLLDIEL